MFKKYATLALLISILVISLVACTSTEEPTADVSVETEPSEETTQVAEEETAEVVKKNLTRQL